MVIVKSVDAKSIPDSRKEKTILISVKTNAGNFSASSPSGKSTGKYEAKPYKNSIEDDIRTIKKLDGYFSKEKLNSFDDLRRVEDIANGHIGANSLFALESAILKAMATEQEKEIWQLVNPRLQKSQSIKFPRLVGNCVGGGRHTNSKKKPDFQEFELIPDEPSVQGAFEKNIHLKDVAKDLLKKADEDFQGKKNDEDAWITSLNEKDVLDNLKILGVPLGVDIASSTFYKRKNYLYANPMLKRKADEQFSYLSNLIENFGLFYIEDPFDEEDFESFAKLLKKFPDRLIVGDDLTVTNYERLKKAIEKKSVNALIVKPNQTGSLMEVKNVCELAKKHGIKIVFSHRSGETEENILADLAFGFQADFFKCGITGRPREVKIKRLIEIERSFDK